MKPLPFSDTLAHPDDPLPLHLLRVAQRAAHSIAPGAYPEARRIAFLAGLFHDIGKATPFFQDYLAGRRRKGPLTAHAKSGSVLAWWYCGQLDMSWAERLSVLIAVLRHHGALFCRDWPQYLAGLRLDLREGDQALLKQLQGMDLEGIRRWLLAIAADPGPAPASIHLPGELPELNVPALEAAVLDRRRAPSPKLRRAFDRLERAVCFLAGFGGLLGVDKIDAALAGARIARQPLPLDAVSCYKQEHFGAGPPRGLDQRRADIAEEVKQTWLANAGRHLLTLTAPTGSGKTLAILDAALALRGTLEAEAGAAPRIVYCLPFTSVIDQNHAVFADVLACRGIREQEDRLLKHHHLVEGVFRTDDAEYAPDGAGQLLTETWQSEIVVTTFYQLLHSLLSTRNADLKRAAQLSGALVLMDEVQAVPLRYWQGLRHLFQAMATALGTRFVLLTATRPLLFRPDDALELLPSHHLHFRALSRVRLHCHHHTPISVEAFTDRLVASLQAEPTSTLVILNRRAAVRQVFEHLRERLDGFKLMALSTDLTPRHRRSRIRLIQRLLRRGEPLLVVSTQLVEAGVDVSFPVVHRDLAPLDAVIQSAGRCNRHAAADSGAVHLWQLQHTRADGSPGGRLWERVYDAPLIEAGRQVLGEQPCWEEASFLDLSRAYFEACWARMDQCPVDDSLRDGNFEQLARDFRLIPEGPPRRTLFVLGNAQDQRLWDAYLAIQHDLELGPVEKDRAFRPLRRRFYDRVIQVYATPDPDEPVKPLPTGPDTYTRETGFIGFDDADEPSWIL